MPGARLAYGARVTWDLQSSYDAYPQIEDAFEAGLDASLNPRGPGFLYDLVAAMNLPRGAAAVDVGCGEGAHSIQLERRFGFDVVGIDPVERHIEVSAAADGAAGVRFVLGSAEHIPLGDESVDLVWCRDVLVHVADLDAAYREFHRVLRPGGRVLVYQMCLGPALVAGDEGFLATMGVIPSSADREAIAGVIARSGLRLDERVDIGTEWGEYAQETNGGPARKMLHAARLLRDWDRWVERYGEAACQIKLGDSLWHVYAMIGKLTRTAYLLTKV